VATSTNYTGYQGGSLILTCLGANMAASDVIWQMYPVGNPTSLSVIYTSGALTSAYVSGRFTVNTLQYAIGNISTSLTISGLVASDANYVYQCTCNIYGTCAGGNTASAIAQITALSKF
jgi:hypothetical protein